MALFELGQTLHLTGKPAQAETVLRQGLDLNRGPALDHPGERNYQVTRAWLLTHLGVALRDLKRFPEAEKALRTAHGLLARLKADADGKPDLRFDRAYTAGVLGDVLLLAGRPAEAEVYFDEVIRLLEARADRTHPRALHQRILAGAYNDRGEVLVRLSRVPEAEKAFREAIQRFGKLAADYPAAPGYRKYQANAGLKLGGLLIALRRDTEAEEVLSRARGLLEGLLRQFPEDRDYQEHLVNVLVNLGPVLRKKGRDVQADQFYDRALALSGPLHAAQPERFEFTLVLALIQAHRGALLKALKREPEADAAYRQAVALESKLAPRFAAARPDHKNIWAKFCFELGSLATFRGELNDARRLHEQALGCLLAPGPGERTWKHPAQLSAAYTALLHVLLRLRDHRAASRRALEMTRLFPAGVNEYALAGGCFAACTLAAERDERLSPKERQALARSYAEQGVEMLREAVRKRGPNNEPLRAALLKSLQEARRADALRAYPVWQQLFQELAEVAPQ
jgi:tetratricopeptide (TPR) repeat protein